MDFFLNLKSGRLKRWSPLLFFICFGLTLQAQVENPGSHKKWTLRECVEYALDNNLDIEQANLDLEDVEIDKLDAIGNFLPDISANANNSWNSGLTEEVSTGILQQQTTRNFSLGASANLPLFHGLKNIREKQRAKLSKLASEFSLGEMKDDIMLNVADAYLEALVNKEQVKILKEQNELTGQELKRTKEQIEAGTVPEGDSLEIKATDADEKQQIISAENDVKIALINLAQILQITDYKNFDIADADYKVPVETLLNRDPDQIIENAKENRYEIKSAEKELELAKKDVQIAKSDYYPTLDAFANFNTRQSGADIPGESKVDPDEPTEVIGEVESTGEDVVAPNTVPTQKGARPFFKQLSRNKGWSYGLTLNIPILNGFTTRNSVKRSKIDVKRSKNELEQTKLDLESQVYQAYVDAQGAAKEYQAAQTSVLSQEKAFEYSKERYDVGTANAFDFSQSKQDLAEAQTDEVSAKYDYIFKLKVLELYFGIDPEDIEL